MKLSAAIKRWGTVLVFIFIIAGVFAAWGNQMRKTEMAKAEQTYEGRIAALIKNTEERVSLARSISALARARGDADKAKFYKERQLEYEQELAHLREMR